MEKIENNICKIVVDKGYENFVPSVIDNENNVLNLHKKYDKILIITDENINNYQMKRFLENSNLSKIHIYILKPGEQSKSIKVYEEIMEFCIKNKLSRKSLIIAFGGGVVGDLGGYVASTYMRGIDVVQVPTSLLAQVDSSIGGKTGINLGNYKNIIGTFYQPKLTYINTKSLETLPQEEFISGMAEVIKYGVIYDYEFIDYLIENSEKILNKEEEAIYEIVKKCAAIKAEVVDKDEKEGGLRKILNFGHTFGHGVEKLCKISHGDAVSIGMNMAFKLALSEQLIDEEYYKKYLELSHKYSLPLQIPKPKKVYMDSLEKLVLEIMKKDKKNSFDKITLILPTEPGKVKEFNNIEDEKILKIIKETKDA